MRTNYYHTRNYRPREYSQSPQNEPVCQNPHRRTNISIDNYYSKTSHLQSNTIKDPQSSGYYTRYSNAFANSSKKYPYSYGKTFDINKSHKQQFQITSHPFHHGLIFCQGLFHFCKDLYPSALRLPNCHRLKLYTALNYESEEVAAIYPYSKAHFPQFCV